MKKTVINILTIGIISIMVGGNASALTEQSNIDVSFKFNDTLTVSLSSPNLVISNLAPGTVSDSNIITVNVLSNNPYGYTLNSTVGSSTSPYSTYGRNLVHTTSSPSTTPFSSLDYGTSIPDLSDSTVDPNTWGYSFSLNDGTTWSNYSGLPLYTDTEHISTLKESTTTSAATGDNIEFKIAAKASSTQLAGEYQNIINFIATGAPTPKTIANSEYLQEVEVCDATVPLETTYTLKDSRDEQSYTVARLKDGKCWMTTNLNLAGGSVIDSTKSDVPANYTLPTENGFQSGNRLPISQIIVSGSTLDGGFLDSSQAYVFNSGNDSCMGENPCYSYYSWTTATVGSGLSITTDDTDAPYSICPKGWHLPSTRTGTDSSSDFRALIIALGGSSDIQTYDSSTTPTGAFIYNKLVSSPYNYTLSGGCNNSNFNYSDGHGSYYSSTSISRDRAHRLRFNSIEIQSVGSSERKSGSAIRCIANNS